MTAPDAVGRWLRGRAPWPLLVAALVVCALDVARVTESPRVGMDNAVVVRAAETLLDGGSPYADKRFLYLPGAVFAAVPQTAVAERVLFYAVPVGTALLVLVGVALALRIFEVRADSRLAVAVIAGLGVFLPFHGLVHLGNWTVVSVVAFPAALLLIRRGRWCAAAGVIGVAVALKPMLVPLLLLFVLARRRRALAVAVGVPAVVSSLSALAMPRPGLFFTRTLPFLLHGQDAYARPFDASWPAVLPRLGVPQPVAFGLAALAAGTVLLCARARWRAGGNAELRLVECASLLMLAAFLVSRPSFLHYMLVVLPSLVASVVVRGAAARSVWFWLALLPQFIGVHWPYVEGSRRHAFKDIVMITGVAGALCLHIWRGRTRGRVGARGREAGGVSGGAAGAVPGRVGGGVFGRSGDGAPGRGADGDSGGAAEVVPGRVGGGVFGRSGDGAPGRGADGDSGGAAEAVPVRAGDGASGVAGADALGREADGASDREAGGESGRAVEGGREGAGALDESPGGATDGAARETIDEVTVSGRVYSLRSDRDPPDRADRSELR